MADELAVDDATDPNTEMYLDALSIAWEDGELTIEGKIMLEGLQERLSITEPKHENLQIQVFEDLAEKAAEEDRNEEALQWYERICERDPNNEEGWRQRGLLLGKLGRDNDAIECFRTASQIASGAAVAGAPATVGAAAAPAEPTEAEVAAAAEEAGVEAAEPATKTVYEFQCPKCSKPIQVEEWDFPLRIECPNCGVKGTLKNPPKRYEEKEIPLEPVVEAAEEAVETAEEKVKEEAPPAEIEEQLNKLLALKKKLDMALERGKIGTDVYEEKLAQVNKKMAALEGATESEGEGEAEAEVEEKESITTIKCPKCKGQVPVYSEERPLKIECPSCGAKGTLK